MRNYQCKFGGNRALTEGTLLLKARKFLYLFRLALQCGDSNIRRDTPMKCTKPVEVRSKSSSNEGHFTLEPEIFVPISPIDSNSHVALPSHASQSVQVGRNRAVTKGSLLLRPEQIFGPILPRIAAGSLKHHTCYSLPIGYKHY
jgi:hypothetical protein